MQSLSVFGVLIFNFLSTVGLTGSQGQFSDPNLKIQNFKINYIWVVLTMFPVFFRKKKIFKTKTPLLVDLSPKFIFFSETAINNFAALFEWLYMILCFEKKIFILFTWGQLFSCTVRGQKFFVFFLTIRDLKMQSLSLFWGLTFSFFDGPYEYPLDQN